MFDELEIILDKGAYTPELAYDSDVGYDLRTPYMAIVPANRRICIDTGVHVNIPKGYYIRLESKSGLMRDKGITCRGTISSGFQGSIKPVIFNHSDTPVVFEAGDKIVQMVMLQCFHPQLKQVETFEETSDRGNGEFGSTGR